jgi:cardiolipin synthase
MDPFIDRLTVISGAVVCWSFELLPRWALLVLAARELAMLGLAEYGLRQGVDLSINWAGRIGVFWIMAGIFFAMVFAGWVPTAFLLFGLFMALIATALYARDGVRAARASKQTA